jgi:hypothetical protein
MKTLEQIKEQYKSNTLDSRDLTRLAQFVPEDQLPDFGLRLLDDHTHEVVPFTRENVLIQLEKDVSFGFEKALDRRGISSNLMYNVVMMWNWILEEGLEDFDDSNYSMYGLPLFKATANKYGFKDEIPGKNGNESEFSDYDEYQFDY